MLLPLSTLNVWLGPVPPTNGSDDLPICQPEALDAPIGQAESKCGPMPDSEYVPESGKPSKSCE